MKHLSYLFLLIFFFSCNKTDINSIPANIKISNITLNTNSTENITDAWVYINDQLQGVYELPAQFPVLNTGTHKLRVKAGIKDNGIASSRIPYPFYGSYTQEEVEFIEHEEMEVFPEVDYIEDITILTLDEELTLDRTSYSDTTLESIEDYYAGYLDSSLITFEISTNELEDLPQAGAPVYLELDYKCNTEFLVGVYINYNPTVVKKEALWINPKEDWNKIYVNLTSIISEGINAPSFSIFIGMRRDISLEKNELYFKNFKIVY